MQIVPNTRIKDDHDTGGIIGQVFWVQLGISFLMWIGVGFAMARHSAKLRAHSFATAPTGRAVRCAALLGASPLGIFIPLWIVWNAAGIKPEGLQLWAWALVTLGGFACVACATLGLAYAVSMAMESAVRSRQRTRVTPPEGSASSKEDCSPI